MQNNGYNTEMFVIKQFKNFLSVFFREVPQAKIDMRSFVQNIPFSLTISFQPDTTVMTKPSGLHNY